MAHTSLVAVMLVTVAVLEPAEVEHPELVIKESNFEVLHTMPDHYLVPDRKQDKFESDSTYTAHNFDCCER